MNTRPVRKRIQAIAQGRGQGDRIVAPLAFDVAAQISARPLEEFHRDPTQLANGLSELQRALQSEVICCALANGTERVSGSALAEWLNAGTPVAASLEACRRLRATAGDQLGLLVGLTGPATLAGELGCEFTHAATLFGALIKEFCTAGADIILVFEPAAPADIELWGDTVKTAGNIARFHRAVPLLWDREGPLPRPQRIALDSPSPATAGIITTDAVIPADISIEQIRTWLAQVSS
jgi:hypothetical protein